MTQAKRGTKEVIRQQVLETTPQVPDNAVTDWVATNKLVKEKQVAVAKIMLKLQTKAPPTTEPEVQTRKKKCVKTAVVFKAKKTRSKATHKKTNAVQLTPLLNITNTITARVSQTVQLCGCRHGDLSVLKSFTKSEATFYTRPYRYLEGKGCLDCKQRILDMRPATPKQKAVVFYCDEGIKGFDAPDDDPMKAKLTCDLVLCPQCEAI